MPTGLDLDSWCKVGGSQFQPTDVRQHLASYLAIHPCASASRPVQLAELGRRRTQSLEHEAAEAAPKSATSASKRTLSAKLARGSAAALLLPPEERASNQLDGRQHNGHAAELAIELLAASRPSADAAAAEAVGNVMVERINSKLSRAGSLPPQAQVGSCFSVED